MTSKTLGVCNLCEAICGLELTLDNGAVTGVRGNPDDPLSRGHICPKGVAIADIYTDPDRLRRPVRRRGTEWEEIGWDEAFDLVAERLAATAQAHGNSAIGVYLGNPNVHSLGSQTHMPAMLRTLRTRNIFSATSVDQLPHQVVSHLLYGHQLLVPIPDIDRTQYFVVFGGNPMASNGSLMTVPDFPGRLRELHARGGRMVVFDPRRTETAKVADEHVFVRPGTDAYVLLAMLSTVFAEGLTDVPEYVDGVAHVEAAVAPYTPELAEQVSGVPAETIRRITREYVASGAGAVYGRMGVSTQAFGALCQWAIQCLNAVTGNLDREGGVLFTEPAVDIVGRRLIGRGHIGKWRSRVRDLPEMNGELPVSTMADEILTPGKGQVRAMVTLSGNPVLSTPDGKRLGEALAGLDFMVAVDIYLNETTRHADVILPPTSALERDHYDLAFHALAVRNTARFTPAVFPKPDGAKHDYEIYREVALRVARRLGQKQSWQQWIKSQARLRATPTMIVDLMLRTGSSKLSVRALKKQPAGVDLGALRPTLPARLQTKGKRIDLAQRMLLDDLGRLAGAELPADGELVLIGRRHKQDCNSWMHNTPRLTKGRPRHHLLMHPLDMADRGIDDGTVVTVASRVGKVSVEVQATEDMMRGVVSLPHGYGHAQPGTRLGHATTVPGVSINDLTDPERLDLTGNAALSGVPVTVSA
ncbi:MAG TPA: molybdopterin-dependent oxidoreductase [Nocardioidaceae bacterium]|nr:molybdopterin-dependent oxidoreductase [Nocardioidaceae bacterium]